MRNRLRLFSSDDAVQCSIPATVTVRLGEILESLADAYVSRKTFVDDFSSEEVQISADLYEVLMASVVLRKSA
ncbi:MAG: hypothetical protein O3B13_07275 [Planctomycetota bacterium]|nr:hypothetical protein [Planctomycetota bacterium]MDA1162885.1 hypothetical protein [Planctomycetota bacterium]